METSECGPAVFRQRCREIDRELAALREDQRLFRRLGFGENIKVMHIVALQAEREECCLALRGLGVSAEPESPDSFRKLALRQATGIGALGVGLLLCFVRTVFLRRRAGSSRARTAIRIKARRAVPEPVRLVQRVGGRISIA